MIKFFDLYTIDNTASIHIINPELNENEFYEYIGYQDGSELSSNAGLYGICILVINRS